MKIAADVKWLKEERIPYMSIYTYESMINDGLEVEESAILIIDMDSVDKVNNMDSLEEYLLENFNIHDADILKADEYPEKGLCYKGTMGNVDTNKFDRVFTTTSELFKIVVYYKMAHETARLRTISTLVIVDDDLIVKE